MPSAGRRVHRTGDMQFPRGEFRCELCPNCSTVFTRDSARFHEHLRDVDHKYNYYMYAFKDRRKQNAKNRHGVVITTSCDTERVLEDPKDGTVKSVLIDEPEEVVYKFKVANDSDEPLKLCEVFRLHPFPVFTVLEEDTFQNTNQRLELLPHTSCVISVRFKSEGIGNYGVPIIFSLFRKKPFYIIRMMVIDIVGPENIIHNPDSPFKPGNTWFGMLPPIRGTTENGKKLHHVRGFELKPVHRQMFENWLNHWPRMSDEAAITVDHVLTMQREGYKSLREHYVPFFHILLHLEEYDSAIALQCYNMSAVEMEQVRPGVFKVKIPGLAEKRPSVLRGDLIYVRFHHPLEKIHPRLPDGSEDKFQYEGRVSAIFDEFVHISCFSPLFLKRFEDPSYLFDFRFAIPRFPFVVVHKAVDLVHDNQLMDVLFPSSNQTLLALPSSNLQPPLISDNFKFEFFNPNIRSNEKQVQAVRNIVSGVCRPSPYIIFGPPGTGKTATVVEAVLQVKKLFLNSNILVCAPSNSACDVVTLKLSEHCSSSELLRLFSSSRDLNLVSHAIRNFSLLKEDEFQIPSASVIVKYRIVVCTLVTASRFANLLKGKNHFTHIFIDECGHALEPEAIAAFAGILGPAHSHRIGGQLILAGDPKQLGPVCVSKCAEMIVPRGERQGRDAYPNELAFLNSKIGLGISLLERLMVSCDVYTKKGTGSYDPHYTTKLLLNYRSHPDLLKLPNELFYENELLTRCPNHIQNDPLFKLALFDKKQKKKVQPLIFHGIRGHERGEGSAPSYFNVYEITQVLKYVEILLSCGIVEQTDIGVIAPYIRQVYKLKKKFEEKNWKDIEVGTTEVFQGREKRIIIISTVRANRDLLDNDKKFRIGFLNDAKRFNVAITRAQSLLIVIGDPFMIGSDSNWLTLIQYSRSSRLNSYRGCTYQIRDEEWKRKVIETVTRMNENSQ